MPETFSISALREELRKDQYADAVLAGDCVTLAGVLNEKHVDTPVNVQPVPRGDIKALMMIRGRMMPILADTTHASAAEVRALFVDPDFLVIYTDQLVFQGLLAGLRADELIDDTDLAMANALSQKPGSIAENLWGAGKEVSVPEVGQALLLP